MTSCVIFVFCIFVKTSFIQLFIFSHQFSRIHSYILYLLILCVALDVMAEKSFKFACQTRGQTKPKSRVKQEPVDWTKCFLCQEDKQEHLQDPRLYRGLSPGSGYATIAGNIHRFRAINSLPMKLNSSFFEDETLSLGHLLSSHTAKWHKSCNLKFNTTELKGQRNAV